MIVSRWIFHPSCGSVFILAVSLASVGFANAQRRPLQEEKVGDGVLATVLAPDAIPAVTHPVFAPRAQAERWMQDDEPVLGLVDPVSGQAKAYSLWYLDRHEIVNDRLGDQPIAVTW